jgi:hypothetical protein
VKELALMGAFKDTKVRGVFGVDGRLQKEKTTTLAYIEVAVWLTQPTLSPWSVR